MILLAVSAGLMWLNVDNPVFVVAGDSMRPTLDVGDLVLIEGAMPGELKTGDIVAFYSRSPVDTLHDITIHRIESITLEPDGQFIIKTKGDNNPDEDPFYLTQDDIKGRVIARVPQLGLYLKNPINMLGIGAILLILLWPQRRQ
ncbi:MAG: signal peptidase I [Candidatus Bathyarchaeia archaeon]